MKKEDAAGTAQPLPPDRYRTIVCDLPWPMEKVLREVRPNQLDFDYPARRSGCASTAVTGREACKIADVVSDVVELNGTDPLAYVLDLNVHRRHLSKAQLVARLLYCCVKRAHSRRQPEQQGS